MYSIALGGTSVEHVLVSIFYVGALARSFMTAPARAVLLAKQDSSERAPTVSSGAKSFENL